MASRYSYIIMMLCKNAAAGASDPPQLLRWIESLAEKSGDTFLYAPE